MKLRRRIPLAKLSALSGTMRLQAAIVLLLLLRAQADTCSSALQKYNCSTSTSPSACRACAAANPTVAAACPNKIELYFLCAGARPTPSPPPAPGPPTGRRPANPSNLTVYGLRPYEIPGLSNKDTADAEGDVYFWMVSSFISPRASRRASTFSTPFAIDTPPADHH